MISFELAEDQRIVRSTLREFAASVLRPASRRIDDAEQIDAEILAALWSLEIVQSLASSTSTEGDESSCVTNAVMLEELAAGDSTVAAALAAPLGFVQAIATHGTQLQRDAILPSFTGDVFQAAAVAVVEPHFGFDVSQLRTRARQNGNTYDLNGAKAMVPLAAHCRYFLVIADNAGALDAFIVPADMPGVSIVSGALPMGLCALGLAELRLDGVQLPVNMRLGESNGADVQRIIDSARVGLSAILTGLSRAVFEFVIPYTKDRVVMGSPLAQKQSVAFNIADMSIYTDAMRWMTWKAAWELDSGLPATRSCQLANTFASEYGMTVADNGVQMLGGHGYVRANLMELWYRNARALSVLEGAVGV